VAGNKSYPFGDVMRFSGASRSHLTYWTDIRVIVPEIEDADGPGHRRRFSFRNLYETAIAVELATWKLHVEKIRTVVEALSRHAMSGAAAAKLKAIAPSLRGFDAYEALAYVDRNGAVFTYSKRDPLPKVLRRQDKEIAKLGVKVTRPKSGLVINLGAILRELEHATGDTL
jgi:DNA-binding transcriptional MerR regulator